MIALFRERRLRERYATEGLIAIIGFFAIYYASEHLKDTSVWHHVVRDLGIACVISVMVAGLYENAFRWQMDIEKLESVLGAVYNVYVPANVWGSIKDGLLKRQLIRNNTQIRVKLSHVPGHSDDWIKIEIEQAYEALGLTHEEVMVDIIHEVDGNIHPPGLIPRFLQLCVDEKVYSLMPASTTTSEDRHFSDGKISIKGQTLTIKQALSPITEKRPVNVRLKREEYRRCPGLYYLVQTELTNGIMIELVDCPSGFNLNLKIRQRKVQEQEVRLTNEQPIVQIKELFFPGQCLEFTLCH